MKISLRSISVLALTALLLLSLCTEAWAGPKRVLLDDPSPAAPTPVSPTPPTPTPADPTAAPMPPAKPEELFTDVGARDWFYPGVCFVLDRGLFQGVGNQLFRPKGSMTRAMLVTVLWRLAGEPQSSAAVPFRDVPADKYYAEPVAWAWENGIVSGVSQTSFRPGDDLTRQQLAAILFRYGQHSGADLSSRVSLDTFPDASLIHNYARDGLACMVANNIIRGSTYYGIYRLDPRAVATRAQVATMIERYVRVFQNRESASSLRPAPPETPAPEKSTTELWIEGSQYPCYALNGVRYIRLSDLAAALGTTLYSGYNLTLRSDEHTLYFSPAGGYVQVDERLVAMGGPCVSLDTGFAVPVSAVLEAAGFHELYDQWWNMLFYARYPTNDQIPQGYKVPILRYHAVSDETWGNTGAFISPKKLEQQFQALLKAGCTPITFEDLGRVDQIQKPVILSFDDGYRDNYTNLFPLIQKYGIPITIFLVTDAVGNPKNLTKEMVREMQDSGLVSFQSHTLSHPRLDTISDQQLKDEIQDSVYAVARLTGKQPFVFSYPEARTTEQSRAYVKESYAFSVYKDNLDYITGTDPYEIPRHGIWWDCTMERFLDCIN